MKRAVFYLLLLLLISIVSIGCKTEKEENRIASFSGEERVFTLGGAPIKAKLRLSREEIPLTETLTLRFTAEVTEDVELISPWISEQVFSPLTLIAVPKKTTEWSADQKHLIYHWFYKLEPESSGEFSIQGFEIKFRLKSEKSDDLSKWPVYTIRTDPVPYKVTSVPVSDTDDIRGLKGLIFPKYNYIPLLLSSLFIGAVVLGWWLYKRFYTATEAVTEQKPSKRDFYLEALRELDNLQEMNLIDKQEFKELHTQLSTILRQYIELYFEIPAREQTTEEFIKEISGYNRFTADQRTLLERFLHLADLVKFATFSPEIHINQEAMKNIRDFVEATGGGEDDGV